MRVSNHAFISFVVFLCVLTWNDLLIAQSFEKMDETWTVTVNGQAVQVNADGSFTIPNVSAPDQFGVGGPGTSPDFTSDDFLRAIGVSTVGGTTKYAFSEPFRFRRGEPIAVGFMTITDSPPPFPTAVKFEPVGTTLTSAGQTVQLQLTGRLLGGSTIDVTPRSKWTTYRTSNPAIAMVGPDGLVTAGNQTGFVFITALNEAAAAVTRVTVALGDPLTTVEGFVQLENRTPVAGAKVVIIGFNLETTTDALGHFVIANVPTNLGEISVRASNAGLLSTATNLTPVPGGITDAGIIQVASPTSNQALEFMLVFQRNYTNSGGARTVFISGNESASGTVEVPGISFIAQFNVTPGIVTAVPLPATVSVDARNGVVNRGVFVSASRPVNVYGLNQIPFTTDAFAAIPLGAFGKRYRVMSYKALGSDLTLQSQLAVVAVEDGTQITVVPSVTTLGRTVGVPFNVLLNRFEVYQLGTDSTNKDLTGTLITSDKPVGVFGGNACANVPSSSGACDHLSEQMPPTTTWGNRVITVPLATRRNGDTFRILADENMTAVQISGPNPQTFSLGAGQFAERILTGNNEITSDRPILVAQYSNGSSFDGVTSDPFMMLIPPSNQFLNNYTFATPGSGIPTNFVNVVAPTVDAQNGLVLLDGAPVAANKFTAVGATGFSCAKLPIVVGSHVVTAPKPLGIFVYGFASFDSYGYPGGFGLFSSNGGN